MKKLMMAAGLAGTVALVAKADTIAWWHFDEADAGVAAAQNSIACDEAPTLYAKPYSYAAATETLGSGDYLPMYVRPFIGRKVYDPVTGTVRANRAAMAFKIARGGTNPSANSGRAYYGGALRVSNCGSTIYSNVSGGGRKALTVECFVCTTGGDFYNFAPIVAAVASESFMQERYAIWMQSDGRIGLRFTTTSGSAQPYYNDGVKKVNDGQWHHVAFTYDGEKIAIYVDYAPDTFGSGAARTYSRASVIDAYVEGTETWIGGYSNISGAADNGYRRFPGYIDEVRISNTALTPDQFLRLQPEANPASDPDEVLRIRFDTAAGALANNEVVDGKFGGVQAIFNAVSGADASVLDTTVLSGENVYDGVFADAGVSNVASFCQTTNAAGKANFIKAPKTTDGFWRDSGMSATSHNYTVEAFFKARRSSPIRQTVFKLGTGGYLAAQVIFGDDNHPHQVEFCFNHTNVWNSIGSSSRKMFDDGEWHHVAFVSDASNSQVRAYCDYELVESKSVTCMVARGYSLFVGSNENGGGQFFDGWIDDVRVTRRVLRPEEFLTTHAVGSASPNPLLLARFEQNYTFESLQDSELSVTGVGEARTNGNAPTFVKASPGKLLLDGTNGSERVENAYSVYLDKSRVVFPVSRLYEQGGAFTIEMWAKFTGFWESSGVIPGNQAFTSGQAGILRFTQGDSGITYDWYLYRSKGNADTLQIATRILDGTVPDYPAWKLDRNVADGKWHHIAVTMEPFEDNGVEKTRIRLYDDYKLVNNGANDAYILLGRLHTNNNGYRLMVGESSTENPSVIGYVNSLRFTRGLLTPDKFMGCVRKGMTIVVR